MKVSAGEPRGTEGGRTTSGNKVVLYGRTYLTRMGNSSSFKGRFGRSQVSRARVVTALRHRNPVDIIAKCGSLHLMREKTLRDVLKIYWIAWQRIAILLNDVRFQTRAVLPQFRRSASKCVKLAWIIDCSNGSISFSWECVPFKSVTSNLTG